MIKRALNWLKNIIEKNDINNQFYMVDASSMINLNNISSIEIISGGDSKYGNFQVIANFLSDRFEPCILHEGDEISCKDYLITMYVSL